MATTKKKKGIAFKPPVRATKIRAWCKEIIDGAGGFISYEEHGLVIWHISR